MADSSLKRQRDSDQLDDEARKRLVTSISRIQKSDDTMKSCNPKSQDVDTTVSNSNEKEDDNEDSDNRISSDVDFEDDSAANLEEEDDEEREFEVDESTNPILGSPIRMVTIKFFITKEEEFQDWMENTHVLCSFEGKIIGRAHGRYILRNSIRHQFYRDMDEPCQDMSDLAYNVFDRYGYLKDELKNHSIRKGSGAWGEELDYGGLLLIESIQLERDWRRLGLGTLMVKTMIAKTGTDSRRVDFSMAITGWLNWDLRDEINGKSAGERRAIHFNALDIANKFFRSIGFRRIGASSCFGLSSDPLHTAYSISSTTDYDPPDDEVSEDDDEESAEVTSWLIEERFSEAKMLKRMLEKRPLHHAVTSLEDSECLKSLIAHMAVCDKTQPQWKQLDKKNNNLLHIAASLQKPQTVRWLMQSVDEGSGLGKGRNNEGYTPLEALQSKLESFRTCQKLGSGKFSVSDSFAGFPSLDVDCLGFLLGLQNLSQDQVLRLSYGCNCGECVGGFLSPRMKFMLLCEAEWSHDMMSEDAGNAEIWCDINEYHTKYVSPSVRKSFETNKSLRQGFANMYDYIAATLRANKIPNNQNVLQSWRSTSEWPPVTRNFIERGGTVESALRDVFASSLEQDIKGWGWTYAICFRG